MLNADNVVDVMGCDRFRFRKQTVLATKLGADCDLLLESIDCLPVTQRVDTP